MEYKEFSKLKLSFASGTVHISPLTDQEKLNCLPKIIPIGWWWKRFIPQERKKLKIAEKVLEYIWLHGGYEEHQEKMLQAMKEYVEKGTRVLEEDLAERFHNSFKSLYSDEII